MPKSTCMTIAFRTQKQLRRRRLTLAAAQLRRQPMRTSDCVWWRVHRSHASLCRVQNIWIYDQHTRNRRSMHHPWGVGASRFSSKCCFALDYSVSHCVLSWNIVHVYYILPVLCGYFLWFGTCKSYDFVLFFISALLLYNTVVANGKYETFVFILF